MIGRYAKIVIWLLVIIFVVSSYSLLHLYNEHELWGHLPLFQFTSFSFLTLLLLKRRQLSEKNFWKKIGLACLSALFLSIGFPPFPLPFFLFIGFIPLLVALHEKDHRYLNDIWLIYFTFILWNIWTTYWVANTAYFAGIFANTVNALLMTLPVLAYLFVVRKLGGPVGLLTFLVCWITFEFLHMRWELYWPWLTLGNGLAKMPFGVQWYSYTGVLGGSAWILIVNYLLFKVVSQPHNWRLMQWFKPLAWLIVPGLISAIVYFSYREKGEPVEIVSVQTNFEPHFEKFSLPMDRMVAQCLEIANSEISPETEYVILPETTFSRVDLDRPFSSDAVSALANFAAEKEVKVISGLSAYRFLDDEEEIKLSTTRAIRRQDGNVDYIEQYNCAVQIDPEKNIEEYYKALYVPGAEFFPFKKILFFLKPIVDQLGGTINGYRIRQKFNVFTGNGGTILAPAICYESIFGEFMTHFVKKGANIFLVMTNDGWWDNTAGHRQHADFARLRAIECRRDVVRSANMGTSCIINQRGDISQKTTYAEANAINVTAFKNNDITFYVKWGDFIGRISLFITMLLMARAFVAKIKD
ncbi:MAG: apolipoprotein N-acyltransferase [Saprospiraceae bacterium]|nr:apolipoprotein N-acyltransferase [Saprospiraceae bacterium]